METENLIIAARGWRHKHWLGTYYPDDLPEEWQLTYYANDFSAVLVPDDYWDDERGYELDNWLDAVGDDFRFYLECPMLAEYKVTQHFKQQCALFDQRLGGIIIKDDWDIDDLDLSCPVVKSPSLQNRKLSIGFIEQDFDELRKIRVWFEAFDKKTQEGQKVVFVTNREKREIKMESLSRIKVLSEMMGL